MSSVYDENAPRLSAQGFYPLVIGPGVKSPQHYVPSDGTFSNTANWDHERRPIDKSPQPGAGVGVRLGLQPDGTFIVALDLDNDDVAFKAVDVFPSTVTKAGQRGFTGFYRSLKPIPNKDYRVGKKAVVQILADSRQTVVPPTIHPDTHKGAIAESW